MPSSHHRKAKGPALPPPTTQLPRAQRGGAGEGRPAINTWLIPVPSRESPREAHMRRRAAVLCAHVHTPPTRLPKCVDGYPAPACHIEPTPTPSLPPVHTHRIVAFRGFLCVRRAELSPPTSPPCPLRPSYPLLPSSKLAATCFLFLFVHAPGSPRTTSSRQMLGGPGRPQP